MNATGMEDLGRQVIPERACRNAGISPCLMRGPFQLTRRRWFTKLENRVRSIIGEEKDERKI